LLAPHPSPQSLLIAITLTIFVSACCTRDYPDEKA
jgi:hypothetical protein